MVTWEYKFVDLHRGTEYQAGVAVTSFTAQVGELGSQGWEALGEIVVTHRDGSGLQRTPVLMMKRPIT